MEKEEDGDSGSYQSSARHRLCNRARYGVLHEFVRHGDACTILSTALCGGGWLKENQGGWRHRWNLPTLFQEGAIPTICMCVIEPVLECRIQNVLNIVVWVATHSVYCITLFPPVLASVGVARKTEKRARRRRNSKIQTHHAPRTGRRPLLPGVTQGGPRRRKTLSS